MSKAQFLLAAPWVKPSQSIAPVIDQVAETSWGRHLLEIAEKDGVKFIARPSDKHTLGDREATTVASYTEAKLFRPAKIALDPEVADWPSAVHELAHHRQVVVGGPRISRERLTNPFAAIAAHLAYEHDAHVWEMLAFNEFQEKQSGVDKLPPSRLIELAANTFINYVVRAKNADSIDYYFEKAFKIAADGHTTRTTEIVGIQAYGAYQAAYMAIYGTPAMPLAFWLAWTAFNIGVGMHCRKLGTQAITSYLGAKDEKSLDALNQSLEKVAELPFGVGNYLDFFKGRTAQVVLSQLTEAQTKRLEQLVADSLSRKLVGKAASRIEKHNIIKPVRL